jgi:hypothetical protein
MLKIVTKFFFFPLLWLDPRKTDWIAPELSLDPPKILSLDSRSAEYARPREALLPGLCFISYWLLYLLPIMEASKLLPPASWEKAMFALRSSCCCIKAVNLCEGRKRRALRRLFSLRGSAFSSSSGVGTVAAGICENWPPLMFVDVTRKVCGCGPGRILSPSMACLFQEWWVLMPWVCVMAERSRRITIILYDGRMARRVVFMSELIVIGLRAGGGEVGDF